jgi:hypothetical protein
MKERMEAKECQRNEGEERLVLKKTLAPGERRGRADGRRAG